MGCIIWERYVWIFLGLMTIFLVPMCRGTTDPRDVFAINSLYAALGFPILPGWMPFGGDLCADGWQGVQCVNANITGIVLTGANLGGELGNDLGNFSSIIQIDLSNNHIGGSIPSNLPITMRTFFLSSNQFTGSIPENLSALGQLSDLSFNDNHLTEEIPDAFQQLMGLINLDLSGNNLSGQLPPSMGNLSSLTTLHLQNNQLVGVLDVLQDLPLTDLNIENNLFSGPIPDKLLNVPNFRRDGNSFNTTVIPSPPALSPLPSSPVAPSPALTPGKPAFGPSAPKITRKPASKAPNSVTGAKSSTTKRVTWIAIGGLVIVIVLAIGLCFCMSRYCKRSQPVRKFAQNHETGAYNDSNEKPRNNESLPKLYSPIEKGHKEAGLILRPPVRYGKDHERSSLRLQSDTEQEDNKRMAAIPKKKGYHEIDMSGLDEDTMSSPRPPPPPPFLPVDKITANPILQCNESLNGTEGTNSVKVVNGVAVVQGRTRSLVEWFERRERLNSDEVQAPDTTPQIRLETAKISLMLNGHPQITERELTSANDGNVAEGLMQNSRLTKLQLIEPYGTGIVPTQNNRSEQKCDLQESSLAKVGRQRRNASNFRCPSPDYETKEIKNIYVDTAGGNPVASKRVGSNTSSKVVHPSDSKEMDNLPTQKQGPVVGVHVKTIGHRRSKAFVVPSVVPRDSHDGKDNANSRRESVIPARPSTGTSLKPHHVRRPSLAAKFDVERLSVPVESESIRKTSGDKTTDPTFHERLVADDAREDFGKKHLNIDSVARKFEKKLSPPAPPSQENCNESLNGTEGTNSVKVVNGVAVVRGRKRSLVERFERRERLNSDEVQAPDMTPQIRPETAKISLMLNGHPHITVRELTSANDGNFAEGLMQNHDVFLSTLRSRLTKLQVVRHFLEQNNIKGAIDATRKLPDHSVQADLISILMEKTEILTLDLFSCLLPVLLGLLDSKMERHASISLEMLLKLVAVFGPVVHSTISASPAVGVDLHAEQRLECCNQCFIQLQKIQKYLPVLVRRGGLLAKCAQELNVVLQNS